MNKKISFILVLCLLIGCFTLNAYAVTCCSNQVLRSYTIQTPLSSTTFSDYCPIHGRITVTQVKYEVQKYVYCGNCDYEAGPYITYRYPSYYSCGCR